MGISKEQRKKAAVLAFEILSLAKVEADAKKKKDERKEELAALCKSVHGQVFVDNEWQLPESNAVIKVVLNPFKAVDSITGKPMKPEKREEIALGLDNQYCSVDFDVESMIKKLNHDKTLKAYLTASNVKLVQETSYQIKSLK